MLHYKIEKNYLYINIKYKSFTMSSTNCLRKITQGCSDAGFVIQEERIREACLAANFDTNVAINLLLKEEHFKVSLAAWGIEKNVNLNQNLFKRFGKKCDYNPEKIELVAAIIITDNCD